MDLAHLKNNPGAHHRAKRLGCGIGSGHGKTAGKGGKGQIGRTGSRIRPGFEGGQTPLYRRLPKRGFNSFTQDVFALVNVETLNQFSDGDVVTPSSLKQRGILRSFESGIKILGDGDLKKKLTVIGNAFSNTAIKKIQSAEGKCLVAKKEDAMKDYQGIAKIDLEKTAPAKPYVRSPKPATKSSTKALKRVEAKATAAAEIKEAPKIKAQQDRPKESKTPNAPKSPKAKE